MIEWVRRTGPVTLAAYMARAIQTYYASRDPLGAAGDFTTAPEIGQVFGELLGLWCVAVWRDLGQPDPVALVELGPGRGTLMADATRAIARVAPAMTRALQIHLVETSPTLREAQAERVASATWHDSIASLPSLPTLLLANEFLDALPVHHLIRQHGGWHERLVVVADGALAWSMDPRPSPLTDAIDPALASAPEDAVVELCLAGAAVVRDIASHLVACRGAALFIDYGYATPGIGETVQAVKAHRTHPVLATPGDADLTAHVDFARMAAAGWGAGATVFGPVRQGPFLTSLGAEVRTQQLIAANPARARDLGDSLRRLIDPAGMGSLFRVLGLAGSGDLLLPGFGEP